MTDRNNKPLVLLLGNYRPSLTLARTFKARGFDVVVSTHGCERLCQYSAAVSSMWDHSPLKLGPARLASELRSFAKLNPELTAIYPVSEEYVRLIAENEPLFEGLPKIVSMDKALIQKCLDKETMLNLARSLDVPTAPFANTNGLSDALQACGGTGGYPKVLRPRDSTQRIDGNKAVYVENEDELSACFDRHGLHNQPLLIQQKFEGKRHNVYFAATSGHATKLLHAVIDRTDKIDGTGLAVEGRTLNAHHAVVEQTKTLLEALDYNGIGCAQFLVNQETGESSFLEINPRIAGNHALPEYKGLDLGWFNFERVFNERVDAKEVIATGGQRYCWTTGDLMGAKVAYLRKEIGLVTLIGWLIKAAVTAVRSDVHMVFDRKDPNPAIQGLWKAVPRIARWRKPLTQTDNNTDYSNNLRRPT
ncbi:MAG: ATP-grasp domain-containing protein [Pseudomonadota bacterium]